MGYAHNATTRPAVVHSLAELRMALEDKARGQRISQMRKQRRLTQQAMAEKLEVSYRAYQTWEAGKMPEWPNVEKLAKFFRVKPESIIGEDGLGPADVPQLDRVEAMLEAIMGHLGIELPGDLGDPAEALERELEAAAQPSDSRNAGNAATGRARRPATR